MLSALIAMAALVSCKKETPQQNNTHAHLTAMAKDNDDNCANPQNPYDYYGYEHNLGLQATRSVWSQPNATMSQVYSAVADFYHHQYGANFTLPDETTWTNDVLAVNADNENDFANVISNSSLSDEGKTVANQFVALTSNITDATTFADYKSMIVSYEKAVMSNNNLTSADKKALLISSSIARYSMGYWINEMTDGNPSGSNPVQCRNIFGKIKDWWNRATARFDRADFNAYTVEDGGASALGASIVAFFG